MLRKTGLFKKDQSFLSSRKEYLKAASGQVDFKTISKSQLRTLREKVIRNRKRENLRAWLITLIVVAPFIIYGISVFINSNPSPEKVISLDPQITFDQKLTEDLNEFNFLIADGDKWIEKRNWKNAIFRYKQAVELFPNEFQGNYRLALTYSYICKDGNKYCETGKKITNRLINSFPNDSRLIELKSAFNK